jgi:hypothetical protein
MSLIRQDPDPQSSCLGGTVSSPPLAASARAAAAGVTGVRAGRPLSLACEPCREERVDPGVAGLSTTALLRPPAGLLTGVKAFTSVRMSSVQEEKALGLFTEDWAVASVVPSVVLINKFLIFSLMLWIRTENYDFLRLRIPNSY